MKLNIEYGQTIIVAVVFKNKWSWYVTEKDYWFLDLIKLENAYLDKGYHLHDQGNYDDRFNIAVLNEDTAQDFLNKINEFQVSTEELRTLILTTEEMNTERENDLIEYSPALLVHFDHQFLLSCFPEPASFEDYVPDGWIGRYETFLDKVPNEKKYWILNNKDYFDSK